MSFLRNVKVNLAKWLISYSFLASVLFAVVLCLNAEIYTDAESLEKYSAFSALLRLNRAYLLEYTEFCSINVIIKGCGSWLSLFAPIVSAFAVVPYLCDEKKTGAYRMALSRSGRKAFYSAEFWSAALVGGLVILLGYLLYSLIVVCSFPDISEYEEAKKMLYLSRLSMENAGMKSTLQIYLTYCGMFFLYGGFASLPAIVCTAWMSNKYLALCIPMFFRYGISQFCIWGMRQEQTGAANYSQTLGEFSFTVYPESILFLTRSTERSRTLVLCFSAGIAAFCYIVYMITQCNKVDRNEC